MNREKFMRVFKLNNLSVLLIIFLGLAVFCAPESFAQLEKPGAGFGAGGDPTALATAENRSMAAFVYAKRITYIYSGVGVLGLVILAAFGRFQWKWFFMLCGGLFVLAGAQQIVFFLS